MRDFSRSSSSDLDSVVCSACMIPLSSSSRSVPIAVFICVASSWLGVAALSLRLGVVMVAGRPWCTAAGGCGLVRAAGAGGIFRGVTGIWGWFVMVVEFIEAGTTIAGCWTVLWIIWSVDCAVGTGGISFLFMMMMMISPVGR